MESQASGTKDALAGVTCLAPSCLLSLGLLGFCTAHGRTGLCTQAPHGSLSALRGCRSCLCRAVTSEPLTRAEWGTVSTAVCTNICSLLSWAWAA